MRKTLSDVAAYLKEILVPAAEGEYEINPDYLNYAGADDIRKGVAVFRAFLERLYDTLVAEGQIYDKTSKVAHAYENRISLSVYYPFLSNINILLIRTGWFGRLDQSSSALVCDGKIFDKRQSVPKSLECLKFLTRCGFAVDGVDLENKKQDLSQLKDITITYPENPVMAAGLKAFAVSEVEHRSLVNQDVLLRCDWRALMKNAADSVFILKDVISLLPGDVGNFVLELHNRYTGKGLACSIEVKGFHIYIKYTFRQKDVWGINKTLANGPHINVKPVKDGEYADTVQTLNPVLQELIAKGYGCGRKREVGRCDGGCRGLTIPLNNEVLDLRSDIVRWLDAEVEYLKKK